MISESNANEVVEGRVIKLSFEMPVPTAFHHNLL